MAPNSWSGEHDGNKSVGVRIPTDEEFPFTNDLRHVHHPKGKIEQYIETDSLALQGLVINLDGKTETDPLKILDDLIKGKAAFAPIAPEKKKR